MSFFEDFVPGQSACSRSLDVSQDDIVAFASRYDAQDFHVDPEAAKTSFVGRLIGSGWHSCALLMRLMAEDFLLDAASMGAPGIEEVKWLRPLLPPVSYTHLDVYKRQAQTMPPCSQPMTTRVSRTRSISSWTRVAMPQ